MVGFSAETLARGPFALGSPRFRRPAVPSRGRFSAHPYEDPRTTSKITSGENSHSIHDTYNITEGTRETRGPSLAPGQNEVYPSKR